MLNDYMDKAMRHAHYEQIEDGTIFATIPGFDGLWANAPTNEECAKELREVLEGWILLGIAHHDDLPEVDGTTIEIGKRLHA
jgi:predicted RNase H-like HicB family nuclease